MLKVALICILVRALLLCGADTPENNVEGKEMHLYGGDSLYGGDILLSEEERQELDAARRTRFRHTRAVVTSGSKKWQSGEVPYELSSDFNQTSIDIIRSAMERIMSDTDHYVLFRLKFDLDLDYLHIFPGDGCYSHIGRQGGAQNVSIGSKCQVKGVVMHELIHALGRWHEQSRPDRNRYIRVNEGNIKEGYTNNFEIVNTDHTSTQDFPYDYDSIMHYDAFAFSSNDSPTITPLDESVKLDRLGQRERLSPTDKDHIKELYRKTSFWSIWSSWTDCSSSCGAGIQQRSRVCLGEGQCRGRTDEERPCNNAECPTIPPPTWSAWSPWTRCSQTCGSGLRVRIRTCVRKDKCEGKTLEEDKEECNTQQCPEEAGWSAWSQWTLCSTRCEGGKRYRTRQCVLGNRVIADVDQLHCIGESMESGACFVNVSCGLHQDEASSRRKPCSNGSCYNDTCLAGIAGMGCYRMPSSVALSTLRAVLEGEPILRSESLKSCGKYAREKEVTHFALSGDQCYCSPNVTNFITEGPSESCGSGCRDGDCIEVFQITEQESFELSVRTFESCGPDYCKQDAGEFFCSGGVRTMGLSIVYLHITLLVMWTVMWG